MRIKNLFMPTVKEPPSDAQIVSNILMIRAALMRKISNGLFAYLPLGLRSLNKISNIIREELEIIGASECLMPLLVPRELLEHADRWVAFKKELFRLQDRHGVDYGLAPTHEEDFTDIVMGAVQSYRDLPLHIYHISTKFRDEIRPRFGVIRSREFTMKDSYSFHMDENCLDKTYHETSTVYSRSFTRMGLETVSVKADSGAIGGDNSEEFMVLSQVGEEEIIFCDSCNYRSNVEKASIKPEPKPESYTSNPWKELHTPNIITIEDLVKNYDFKHTNLIKTLLYTTDQGETVAILIRGDVEVNEKKLSNYLNGCDVELANEATVKDVSGARVGFAGPINFRKKVRVIADYSIKTIHSAGIGANKDDTHITSVNIERDFIVDEWADLRRAKAGDLCPLCSAKMHSKRGLEVGHIFKLGQKYSKAFGFTVLDENNKSVNPTMGCYGIGINRCLATVIEQNYDDKGIIFPISIAPYEVIIVPVEDENSNSFKQAELIYNDLQASGVEAMLDDRDERFGVKLNDADLIGIPIRIVVGNRSLEKGVVEVKLRRESEIKEVIPSDVKDYIINLKKQLFDEINSCL